MKKTLEQINEQSLNKLIELLNSGFEILMESDLVGLLFHSYLTVEKTLIDQIHIDTRILNYEQKKIDLAIGKIVSVNKRPSINPDLIIECKVLPNGFDKGQLKNRFGKLKLDIAKIGLFKLKVPTYIVIFDYHDFLDQIRKTELIDLKNETDERIKIIRVFKQNNQYIKQEF